MSIKKNVQKYAQEREKMVNRFKVGDIVVSEYVDDRSYGKVGEIVFIKEGLGDCLIDFGKGFRGHDGLGFERITYWWLRLEDIVAIGRKNEREGEKNE